MLKTKIMITYGPSVSSEEVLSGVLRYTDIVRFNFSHGDEAQWLRGMGLVRKVAAKLGREVALLADLPGPKIRTASMQAPLQVRKGETVALGSKRTKQTGIKSVVVDYPLYRDARTGCTIEVGDGDLSLRVTAVHSGVVIAKAIDDGTIGGKKGVNVLGARMSASAPTKTDMHLTDFAARNGFDFVALSFVKSRRDIDALRKRADGMSIVAKIETVEALGNIHEIAGVADAIMVARGDLAIEIGIAKIPEAQKAIIEAAMDQQRPVIVATQLLASMVENPAPTRAEANDIANAVESGADCLMLSDETAVGRYPRQAVSYLAEIAGAAEASQKNPSRLNATASAMDFGMSFAAAELAERYGIDGIFVPTETGEAARTMATLRPATRLVALASSDSIRRSLSLYYGMTAVRIGKLSTMEALMADIKVIAARAHMRRYLIVAWSRSRPEMADTLRYVDMSAAGSKRPDI